MTIDWTIKATDLVMVAVVFAGPLVAVQVTEWIRRRQEARNRKIHLFRTLMSTRAATLAPTHVEALNLIDIEFDTSVEAEKKVVDSWKLYHAHLADQHYPPDQWPVRRAELLVDLLFEMAACLGYGFDKAHIKGSSYYPKGYGEVEEEQNQIRKKVFSLIDGKSAIHVVSHMSADQFDRLTSMGKKTEGQPGDTSNAGAEPGVQAEPPPRRG